MYVMAMAADGRLADADCSAISKLQALLWSLCGFG
jgi:hypothetical protein